MLRSQYSNFRGTCAIYSISIRLETEPFITAAAVSLVLASVSTRFAFWGAGETATPPPPIPSSLSFLLLSQSCQRSHFPLVTGKGHEPLQWEVLRLLYPGKPGPRPAAFPQPLHVCQPPGHLQKPGTGGEWWGGLTTRSAWTGRQMQPEGWSSPLCPGRAPGQHLPATM